MTHLSSPYFHTAVKREYTLRSKELELLVLHSVSKSTTDEWKEVPETMAAFRNLCQKDAALRFSQGQRQRVRVGGGLCQSQVVISPVSPGKGDSCLS